MYPQEYISPFFVNANVKSFPLEILTTSLILLPSLSKTYTGTVESVFVPFPKLYEPLFPHDTTDPSSNTAEALSYPTAMSLTFVNFPFPSGERTCTGSDWLFVFPVPRTPEAPRPQDHTVPSSFNAIVKFNPDDILLSVYPKLLLTVTSITSVILLLKSVTLTLVLPIRLAVITPVEVTVTTSLFSDSYLILLPTVFIVLKTLKPWLTFKLIFSVVLTFICTFLLSASNWYFPLITGKYVLKYVPFPNCPFDPVPVITTVPSSRIYPEFIEFEGPVLALITPSKSPVPSTSFTLVSVLIGDVTFPKPNWPDVFNPAEYTFPSFVVIKDVAFPAYIFAIFSKSTNSPFSFNILQVLSLLLLAVEDCDNCPELPNPAE